MKHLATSVELTELKNSLQDYATKVNQDEFEERVRPLLVFCKDTLVTYQKDNEDMKDCIAKFD